MPIYTIKLTMPQGSDYARAGSMELDAVETMKEELVGIARGCKVGARTIEIGHGTVHYSCSVTPLTWHPMSSEGVIFF